MENEKVFTKIHFPLANRIYSFNPETTMRYNKASSRNERKKSRRRVIHVTSSL